MTWKVVNCLFVVVVVGFVVWECDAQIPPRINIPGAILVPQQARPSGFRQARIQEPIPISAGPKRRPIPANALPIPVREVRPVVEETEDVGAPSTPSAFDNEVSKLGLSVLQSAISQATSEEDEIHGHPLPFRPERPIPVLRQDVRESKDYQSPRPVSLRPEVRVRPQPRQEIREEVRPVARQPPVRQQQFVQQQQPQPQPIRQHNLRPAPRPHLDDDETRTRRPVVQILRKFRTDNADGSITWGYENEDGSFKEETLGVDCITRGKYGYVDPDGVKREYTYETGNKCDEPEEEEEDLPPQQAGQRPRKPQPQQQQQLQFRPQQQAQY